MSKIIEYFYIFSKLSTSIVLIVIIIAMGYALTNSYKEVDEVAIDLDSKYKSIEKLVIKNDEGLARLDNKINSTDNKISDIKNILEQGIINKNNNEYKEAIDQILVQNEILKDEIEKIYSKLKKNSSLNNDAKEEINQASSLVDLILLKYKNGENIKEEISYLNNILPNKNSIFEKINLIEMKKFYGFKNLDKEFDESTENYINFKFIKNGNNNILNFLFKFVDVKPNNLDIFENEELNLIMSAKNFMEKEDLESSLKMIMKIKNYENFYLKWVEQSQLYIEFKNEIKKVI